MSTAIISRFKPLLALVLSGFLVVVLTSCDTHAAAEPERVTTTPAVHASQHPSKAQVTRWENVMKLSNVVLWNNTVTWNHAVEAAQAAAAVPVHRHHTLLYHQQNISSNLSDVTQCVKQHESGNYNESSHPGSGSGAYQYVPGTWRHWSQLAGYAGYAYAFEAPPGVQDAVFQFTLTHGGAHNWDPAFGNDPCTTGMR